MAKKLDKDLMGKLRDLLRKAGYSNPSNIDFESETLVEKESSKDFSHIKNKAPKLLLENSKILTKTEASRMLGLIEEGRD